MKILIENDCPLDIQPGEGGFQTTFVDFLCENRDAIRGEEAATMFYDLLAGFSVYLGGGGAPLFRIRRLPAAENARA